MRRRSLLLALMGVASLAQLPPVLAAPKPKYPRGQIPSFFAIDEAAFYAPEMGYDFGEGDFTVEFWMAPTEKQWEAVVMTQDRLELHGYINGVQVSSGLLTLKDYRFQGAGILAQIGAGKGVDDCVGDFMRHMQQHMPNGQLAELRVTRDIARPVKQVMNYVTYRFSEEPPQALPAIKQHTFPRLDI